MLLNEISFEAGSLETMIERLFGKKKDLDNRRMIAYSNTVS